MYYSKGIVTRQAHVNIPAGTVEEEYAREGFFGRTSHLYRDQPPVGWIDIEGDLKPEAFRTSDLPGVSNDDYLNARVPFLTNADATLAMAILSKPMPYYYRNADCDEILFVHRGTGEIETDFGPLNYEKGDYLVIPRGTVYRLSPETETALLVIESVSQVRLPDKGVLGQHALFDPGVINTPSPAPRNMGEEGRWQLKIKRLGKITTVTYPFNPINVVGWKGDLTVWQLNIRDIRPVLSEKYHLPPTAHCTFMMDEVVVCTFLPRPLETGDPGALRVPFYHNNIDYDEVLFYHEGNFFSREGIEHGMITFHPQGIHHGPQPAAVKAADSKTRTDEKAVMIDTRHPLELTPEAKSIAWPNYWKSWMGKSRQQQTEKEEKIISNILLLLQTFDT